MTGTDRASGRAATVVIEAETLGEVERLAQELGLEVRSIELPQSAGASPEPADPLSGSPPEARPADPGDGVRWSGSPSQWVNFWWYVAVAAGGGGFLAILVSTAGFGWIASPLLLAPLLAAAWKWLGLWAVRYELTAERLRVRSGIFTRHLEEIELYRVKDTELTIPFWQRIVGIGTLRVISSDHTNPNLPLRGIADPESVRERIRSACEAVRRARGVRELDVS